MEVEDYGELTVTIALDSESDSQLCKSRSNSESHEKAGNKHDVEAEFEQFGKIILPANGKEIENKVLLLAAPLLSAPLSRLPLNISHTLATHLNPAVLGSMRNWECIAATLGVPMEEIVALRTVSNPTNEFLKHSDDIIFRRLINIISDVNRIDVLLSLEIILKETGSISMKDKGSIPHNLLQAASTSSLLPTETQISSQTSSVRSRNGIEEILKTSISPILILHHESKNTDNHRFCRSFIHNLRRYSKERQVVDIDSCFDESDLMGVLLTIFNKAWCVIVFLSDEYARHVVAKEPLTTTNNEGQQLQLVNMKNWMHKLSDQEVLKNGGRNERFKLVVPPRISEALVPSGWPSNTLRYRFPEDFGTLCRRLFEDE